MTSRDFCYWLQGFFEIGTAAKASPEGTICVSGLTSQQVDTIRRHLAMVFIHEIDPSFPADQQEALNEIHADVQKALDKLDSGSISTFTDNTIFRC